MTESHYDATIRLAAAVRRASAKRRELYHCGYPVPTVESEAAEEEYLKAKEEEREYYRSRGEE